ncbi:hypothetical protein [Methylocystis sp. S23]|jgi:hypothetical protein
MKNFMIAAAILALSPAASLAAGSSAGSAAIGAGPPIAGGAGMLYGPYPTLPQTPSSSSAFGPTAIPRSPSGGSATGVRSNAVPVSLPWTDPVY